VSEKLLTKRELRIALVGPGAPFVKPPTVKTIRGWVKDGLRPVSVPGRKRDLFRLSEVLAFLKKKEAQQ